MFSRLRLALVLLLFSASLFASPLVELVGATSSVNPLSARFMGKSSDVVYFNPALLPLAGRSVNFSFFWIHSALDVSLMDRDAGLDIQGDVDAGTGIYGATSLEKANDVYAKNLPYKPRPTADLDERGGASNNDDELYASLGLVLPIYKEYLALGITATLPLLGGVLQQNSFFKDEREQNFSNSLHYELYGDRTKIFNLALGLGGGYKWFYAGVGLSALSSTVINTSVYTPNAAESNNKIHVDTEIKTVIRPHFGLIVEPWWKLRFTFTAHLEMQHDISSVNIITFWNINREDEKEINTNVLDVNQAFKPLTLSAGLGFIDAKTGPIHWNVGLTMVWKQWSKYRDRYNETPQSNVYWDYSIIYDDKDGNEQHGDWVAETVDDMRWKNTFDFVLGATMGVKSHRVGLDIGYYPSPVPDQTKRTNYVDNNRLSFDIAYSYEWKLSKKLKLETGMNFESHIMLKRVTNKIEGVANSYGENGTVVDEFPDSECDPFNPDCVDNPNAIAEQSAGFQTNNAGYPGYTATGVMYSLGLWIKLLF